MSWHAPALTHLLEQRLKTARLELLEDRRIQRALHRQGRESAPFLRHLIEDKLAASARAGLGAIEASLRSSATDSLHAAGLEQGNIRTLLDELGTKVLDPDTLFPHELQRDPMRPAAMSVFFFVAWIATITLGWLLGEGELAIVALLATGGLFTAAIIYGIARSTGIRRRADIASEYPAHACRNFIRLLEEGIACYEDGVNRAASAGSN